MVSGKYSAVAGAISREQAIANISNNMANLSTAGYKRTSLSFESLLRGEQQSSTSGGINYNRSRTPYTDFSAGALRQTDDPLDFAIAGEGFFKVQGEEGIRYSRRGDFAVDAAGLLTTSNGLPVLDEGNNQITIPDVNTNKISVSEDGTIAVIDPQGNRGDVARLAVVSFEDLTTLKHREDTTFDAQGAAEQPVEGVRIIQGNLELSNVNMAEELTRMINSYRIFETYHKVLSSYSTIGEQQEELGTLG